MVQNQVVFVVVGAYEAVFMSEQWRRQTRWWTLVLRQEFQKPKTFAVLVEKTIMAHLKPSQDYVRRVLLAIPASNMKADNEADAEKQDPFFRWN